MAATVLSWLAHASAGVAGGLLAKESYETYAGIPGAMDARSLGAATLLLLVSIAARAKLGDVEESAAGHTGKPVLAIDLDECCCGYVPAFIKFMNTNHRTRLELEDFTSYMFWEVPKCGLASREEATDRVYEFHASRFFAQIEPLRGAKIALDHLKQHFELHVVTSRQADIEPQTRAFVEEHFEGTFTGLHFGNHFGRSGAKISKPDMCAKIGAVALLDDSLDYARQCAAADLPVFLFGDYAWNRGRPGEKLDPRITRVANWRMVAQLVTPAVIARS